MAGSRLVKNSSCNVTFTLANGCHNTIIHCGNTFIA